MPALLSTFSLWSCPEIFRSILVYAVRESKKANNQQIADGSPPFKHVCLPIVPRVAVSVVAPIVGASNRINNRTSERCHTYNGTVIIRTGVVRWRTVRNHREALGDTGAWCSGCTGAIRSLGSGCRSLGTREIHCRKSKKQSDTQAKQFPSHNRQSSQNGGVRENVPVIVASLQKTATVMRKKFYVFANCSEHCDVCATFSGYTFAGCLMAFARNRLYPFCC